VVSIGSGGIHSSHRRCVCNVQRGSFVTSADSRSNLEQYLVPAVRVCRYQLHEKLEVRLLRGTGIVDRRVLFNDPFAAAAAMTLEYAHAHECHVIFLFWTELGYKLQGACHRCGYRLAPARAQLPNEPIDSELFA
jgi:hypothetical protein